MTNTINQIISPERIASSNVDPEATYKDLYSAWQTMTDDINNGIAIPDDLYTEIQGDINTLTDAMPTIYKIFGNTLLGIFYSVNLAASEGNEEDAIHFANNGEELMQGVAQIMGWHA